MSQADQSKSGVINAICAYSLWGLAPLYFKLLESVPATEILVHRIVWSFVLLVIVVLAMGHWRKVQQIVRTPKTFFWLLGTAIVLAINWLVFIWAVNNNHILEASLGYFINPLFSIALAMIFLGERLSKWQIIAMFLACAGVLLQLISLGTIPYVAIALATSFGIYGLLRKKMPVDSVPGLLIESAWMLPIGIAYWLFFMESSSSNMLINLILLAAGLVTTAPLLFFTGAAKRLTLTTLGFFQYIGPSIMFIVAIVIFNEEIIFEKLLTFLFIWTALLIYSVDSLRKYKKNKKKIS